MNTIMLDSRESYQKQSSSVAGLDSLIDRFALAVAATSGIPYSFLMGQPPSGLQSTGAADIRMFYDQVKAKQEDDLQPALERLVKLITMSRDSGLTGNELDEWHIKFNPLWQMDEKDEATYRKTVAETDAMYLDRGVLDPAEVAVSRFGGNSYSAETELESLDRDSVIEPDNPDNLNQALALDEKDK
jgi:phage-related protein (TIGR01555 family)